MARAHLGSNVFHDPWSSRKRAPLSSRLLRAPCASRAVASRASGSIAIGAPPRRGVGTRSHRSRAADRRIRVAAPSRRSPSSPPVIDRRAHANDCRPASPRVLDPSPLAPTTATASSRATAARRASAIASAIFRRRVRATTGSTKTRSAAASREPARSFASSSRDRTTARRTRGTVCATLRNTGESRWPGPSRARSRSGEASSFRCLRR